MKISKDSHFGTEEEIRSQGGLYSIYHHGPRERATDNLLGGIMNDHIQRYECAFC